jgi:hypothetical protein
MEPGIFCRMSSSLRRRTKSCVVMHGNPIDHLLSWSHEHCPSLRRHWFLDIHCRGIFCSFKWVLYPLSSSWGEMRLCSFGTSATNWGIVPALDDTWWVCGAVGGLIIGRENRSTWRKPAPAPLCPPQIPHELNWARTQASAMGSRRLTT